MSVNLTENILAENKFFFFFLFFNGYIFYMNIFFLQCSWDALIFVLMAEGFAKSV